MKPVVTFWPNLVDTQGSEWEAPDWETVLRRLSQRREFIGDREHPGWSPGRFSPCERAAEHVQQLYALCLDFDGGCSIEWALEKFAAYQGLVQTTRKHTPELHRFRVVLPLSRAVSAFEHQALWQRVALWCGNVDPSTKDPGRFWFLPGTKPGGEFRAELLAGPGPMNVDAWLKRELPSAQPKRIDRASDPSNAELRALKYIAKMPDAIAGQHGHDATWQVACALACGFDLSEDTTFRILWNDYNGRCQPAWSEKELRHKAKQARQNSRLERGYLLREEREWAPAQRVAAPPAADPSEPSAEADRPEPESSHEETATGPKAPKPIHERYPLFTERQLIKQVFDHVTSDKPKRGFTTGVKELDGLLGGLRSGMILCVGAQTSWGKSTMATMILEENLPLGVKCLVVVNEDQPLMYGRRIVCRRGELNALRVRDGELDAREIGRIAQIGTAASHNYVLLNAMGMPAEQIAEAILACREEIGTQLVLVDYLQRMRTKRPMQDRRNEVSRAAEIIGDAIKKSTPGTKLDVAAAGVVFSQLKRIQDKPPTIEDMKESGDVENMAEHIMLGWRKIKPGASGENNVSRMYNVPKNKDGPVVVDWCELQFNQVTASFTGKSLDERPEYVKQFDGDFDDGSARYP